jgi:exoribonuclease R
MLLANETVASFLEEQAAPSLYRVHEEPDLRVERFGEFISGFGYGLGAPATSARNTSRSCSGGSRQAGEADCVPAPPQRLIC